MTTLESKYLVTRCDFLLNARVVFCRILTNVKRLDLSYVVLIFDASSEPNYKGPGVHHPGIQKETPRGLNLYPTAFSCPERPSNHLPAFVMCIDEYSNDLDTCNKILFYYDSRVNINIY